MTIERFYEYYRSCLNGFDDEKILDELESNKRSTQFMLAGRFITLPKNKKIESQTTANLSSPALVSNAN